MRNVFFILLAALVLCNSCGGTSVESYVGKVDRLVEGKDYRKAIILYQKAISEHPEEPLLYYNQAYLYRKMGSEQDLKRAIADYKAIFRINPKLPYPHYGLGNLFLEQKKYDDAATYFEKILAEADELKPAPRLKDRTTLSLGIVFLEKKAADKALQHLDGLLSRAEPYRDAYYFRARVYAELMADTNKAKADLAEYLKADGKFKTQATTLLNNLDAEKKFDF